MGVVDRQSMKAHMTKSFVLLMLLASSAFAAELSLQQQLDAVQAELAASQAHNKQLLSEVEKLENEKLVGLDGGKQDDDESDPDSELASGTTEDVGVRSPAGGVETNSDVSERHNENFGSHRNSWMYSPQTDAPTEVPTMKYTGTEGTNGWLPGRKCEKNCQGRCWIGPSQMNAKCELQDKFATYIRAGVKFVGTKHWPKWLITSGWKKKPDGSPALKDGKKQLKVIGTVNCPCHDSGGKNLDEETATRKILGQAASLSVPLHIAMAIAKGETYRGRWWRPMAGPLYKGGPNPALTGREIGKMWGVSWNARVSLATIKMIKCWQHVCKGTPMKKLKGKKTDKKKGSVKDEEETILDLDALLDEDEAAETNAGWDCG